MKLYLFLCLALMAQPLSASTDPVSLTNEGLEAYKTGNYDLAIDRYTQALKEKPNNHIIYNDRALAYKEKKDYPACDRRLYRSPASEVRSVSLLQSGRRLF